MSYFCLDLDLNVDTGVDLLTFLNAELAFQTILTAWGLHN